jgi:DNA-binding Xre family transcriptional regulator
MGSEVVSNMARAKTKSGVTFKKLWKLLIDREMKKTEFAKLVNISGATLAKLGSDHEVTLDVLVRVCRKLQCGFDDIMEIVPDPADGGAVTE